MNWHDYFIYDAATGNLTYKHRLPGMCRAERTRNHFNGLYAGKVAGSRDNQGYIYVRVNGKPCRAHRIIWEMHHGPIPDRMVVDHINRNPSDNRIANLRVATTLQNSRNSGPSRRCASGMKGTYTRRGRWHSEISTNGKRKYLGSFHTAAEAHAAYCLAAKELHGDFYFNR